MNKIIAIFLGLVILFSCGNENEKEHKIEVRKGNFYMNELDSTNAVVLADTIRYSVTIKNPNPNDFWTEMDIRRMDELALANMIFNAIYNKRLVAYEFFEGTKMSIKDVRKLEKKYPRTQIGRMQFEEEWYFDEKNLRFGKKIKSIMLAYEILSPEGDARYVPGVLVYLNNEDKKQSENKELTDSIKTKDTQN